MAFKEVIRHGILDFGFGILDRSRFWWLVGMSRRGDMVTLYLASYS
ncbi:MAG: hypothetical protein ACM65M_18495 [Microcoleus sp.]